MIPPEHLYNNTIEETDCRHRCSTTLKDYPPLYAAAYSLTRNQIFLFFGSGGAMSWRIALTTAWI